MLQLRKVHGSDDFKKIPRSNRHGRRDRQSIFKIGFNLENSKILVRHDHLWREEITDGRQMEAHGGAQVLALRKRITGITVTDRNQAFKGRIISI